MAKIVGSVQMDELKKRIKQSKKIRYSKPLTTKIGPILKAALEAERKC